MYLYLIYGTVSKLLFLTIRMRKTITCKVHFSYSDTEQYYIHLTISSETCHISFRHVFVHEMLLVNSDGQNHYVSTQDDMLKRV